VWAAVLAADKREMLERNTAVLMKTNVHRADANAKYRRAEEVYANGLHAYKEARETLARIVAVRNVTGYMWMWTPSSGGRSTASARRMPRSAWQPSSNLPAGSRSCGGWPPR